MGVVSRLRERRRREFDLRCHELRSRGYSLDYVALRLGATPFEVASAVRRVECGRYGDVGGRAAR